MSRDAVDTVALQSHREKTELPLTLDSIDALSNPIVQSRNKGVLSVTFANQPFTKTLCSPFSTTPLSSPRHPESHIVCRHGLIHQPSSLHTTRINKENTDRISTSSAKEIMPSMFSSFDGPSISNRSRNASRHREDRSHEDPDPFNFVSFMNDLGANLQEGGHSGYSTEECRPRDRSHSPSPPHRGRVGSSYATEEVRPERPLQVLVRIPTQQALSFPQSNLLLQSLQRL